jgi:hypothetical protein
MPFSLHPGGFQCAASWCVDPLRTAVDRLRLALTGPQLAHAAAVSRRAIIEVVTVPHRFDNTPYLSVLEEASRLTASGDLDGARTALAPIAGEIWSKTIRVCRAPRVEPPPVPPPSGPFKPRASLDAMRRDRFRCRYCANRIVPLRVLEVLSRLRRPHEGTRRARAAPG